MPSGFESLDRLLGGGFRRQDLVVLGGDVASGKSALGLAIAIRSARLGHRAIYLSGEMSPARVMERAVALETRIPINDFRQGRLDATARAAVEASAARLRDLPLQVHPMSGTDDDLGWLGRDVTPVAQPALLVIDSLQLLGSRTPAASRDEQVATSVRALKKLAIEQDAVVLAIAQLPEHVGTRRDPRPTLDDFGALGTIKQSADVVLAIFREEMYRPAEGVEGATELIVAKNRNGPTGFVDLYFYSRWLRFEDMLDPDPEPA